MNQQGRVALTDRQRDVLALLLEGKSHREVGAALGLSRHTVAHYAKALMHAHGCATDRQLVCRVWASRYAELDARHTRALAALASTDRRSGVDRRRED